MVNIDLKTSGTQERSAYESRTDFSLVLIVIISLIIVGLAGGMYFWKTSLANKIKAIDDEIVTETNKLTSENTKKIMDFQKRIDVAGKSVDEKNVLLSTFAEIEKTIKSDVYIKSVSYEGGALSIKIVAKDFNSLASQIASFKNSEVFGGVNIGVAKVNSDQKVETELTLKIN